MGSLHNTLNCPRYVKVETIMAILSGLDILETGDSIQHPGSVLCQGDVALNTGLHEDEVTPTQPFSCGRPVGRGGLKGEGGRSPGRLIRDFLPSAVSAVTGGLGTLGSSECRAHTRVSRSVVVPTHPAPQRNTCPEESQPA